MAINKIFVFTIMSNLPYPVFIKTQVCDGAVKRYITEAGHGTKDKQVSPGNYPKEFLASGRIQIIIKGKETSF